jgi:hypothetical protein
VYHDDKSGTKYSSEMHIAYWDLHYKFDGYIEGGCGSLMWLKSAVNGLWFVS